MEDGNSEKLVDFAKAFDKFSVMHQELQDEIIRKKQAKIDEFSQILTNFKTDFDHLMQKHSQFIEKQQEKV